MSYTQTENLSSVVDAQVPPLTEKHIQDRIVSQMAAELNISPQSIDVTEPFNRYGLDSLAAVHLMADLEEWLGIELSPTLPYEYPTAQALAEHLSTLDR
jgi:acyl carrier protein